MDWRQSRQEDIARGAIVLAIAAGVALLIIGARIGSQRLAAPPPTATPQPTATPLPTPTSTPVPPTPTPRPQPPTPTPVPVPVAGVDEDYAQDGRNIVCLDPGHGGEDLGNVLVQNGKIVLQEKDFTLKYALALADRLRDRGFEVVLTRDADTEANPANEDVNGDGVVAEAGGPAHSDELDDLQARINICNLASADLLVSMHLNSAENVNLSGFEVWYNDERPFSGRSEAFATTMYEALGDAYTAAGYDAVPHGIGIDSLVVLGPARPGKVIPSEMPGAVVEALYLSNADDAAFLESDKAADAIVGAYEKAITDYFAAYPG